jgi:hypothetical protein
MKKILSIVFLIIFPSISFALMPINLYQKLIISNNETEKRVLRSYVGGLKDALSASNAFLEIDNKKPLYCPPRELALTTDVFIQLINDGLSELEKTADRKSLKEIKEGELSQYTVLRMKEVFPC